MKNYPKSHLVRPEHWGELIKLSEQEVQTISDGWKQIAQENKELSEQNQKLRNETIKEFTDLFDKYKVKYKNKNRSYVSWFEKNIKSNIHSRFPTWGGGIPMAHCGKCIIDGIQLHNNQSPTSIVELYHKLQSQYQNNIQFKNQHNERIKLAIKKAQEYNIDIDGVILDDIFDHVNRILGEQWLQETYKDGDLVDIDDNYCDDCSQWIFGSRRCTCGNRRIDHWVAGDFIKGYYLHTEPY